MRRDVSKTEGKINVTDLFSLHAQRCFLCPHIIPCSKGVFSACAEMFLKDQKFSYREIGFLCMRRDVSQESSTSTQ